MHKSFGHPSARNRVGHGLDFIQNVGIRIDQSQIDEIARHATDPKPEIVLLA